MIFGSTAYGRENVSSDVDSFVVITHPDAYAALTEIRARIYQETHVVIETAIEEYEFSRLGYHSITNLLRQHLQLVPRDSNHVGEDVLSEDILKPHEAVFIQELVDYYRVKGNRMRARRTHPQEDKQREALEDTFDLVSHLPRKVIQVVQEQRNTLVADDTKETIRRTFKDLDESLVGEHITAALTLHDDIVRTKDEYIHTLTHTVETLRDPVAPSQAREAALQRYSAFLSQGQIHAEKGVHFLREMGHITHSLVIHTREGKPQSNRLFRK